MIEVINLTKRYGHKRVVDNITFSVKKGEIVGFLGPNGAGKTTTMNILTGYLSATEGSCKIDGIDIFENPTLAKSKIGFLPEHPPLYTDMTVIDYLSFVYDLKKVKLIKQKHLDEVLEIVKITEVKHRLIKNLSKGYRQRVGLAQALVGNPEILILDEPTVGLDPKQIIEIRNLIKKLRKNHTIILSSHILPEVAAVCDRIVVIIKGKLVANDKPENLSGKFSEGNKLHARIAGNKEDILNKISTLDKVTQAKPIGSKETGTIDVIIEAESGADIRRELFDTLAKNNMPIYMLKQTELNLEDIFVSLVEETDAKTEENK